jgi:exodeoxyribonuclease VII small subunit
MSIKPTAAKTSEQTFETAIERLEAVVREMESDKLPLEDLLVRYEEGTKLVKVCEARLQRAEKRIQIIAKNAAGEARLEEFEPEKKAPADGPEQGSATAQPRRTAAPPREETSLF